MIFKNSLHYYFDSIHFTFRQYWISLQVFLIPTKNFLKYVLLLLYVLYYFILCCLKNMEM